MKTFHTLVSLDMPTKHADAIVYVGHLVESFTGNVHVPNPTPPLATVTTHLAAYQAAHTAAQTHAKGLAPARDLALAQVMSDVHQLEACAQAAADANPAQAAAIITSLGFGVRRHGAHVKADLAVKMGPGGLVLLRAHAVGKHASNEWQVSTDGGKTWTALPSTTTANTSVAGLTIGQSYWFRFRGNVGQTVGDWHEPVALLVH